MTLKERFKKQLDTATPTLNRPFYQAEKCEKIADEFAIEFAEWICEKADIPYIKGTMNGTLEIFKKEKGL
jgi:hypothetical protein